MLVPGKLDNELLDWPFRSTVRITLMDRTGSGNHFPSDFKPNDDSAFKRPEHGSNIPTSCIEGLIPLELIYQANSPYINEDSIIIEFTIIDLNNNT